MSQDSRFVQSKDTIKLDSYLADLKAAGFTALPQITQKNEKYGFMETIRQSPAEMISSERKMTLTATSTLQKGDATIQVSDKLTNLRAANDSNDNLLHGILREDLSVEKSLVGRDIEISDGKRIIKISFAEGGNNDDGDRFLKAPVITVYDAKGGPGTVITLSEENKKLFNFAQLSPAGKTTVEGINVLNHKQLEEDLKSIVNNSGKLLDEAKKVIPDPKPQASTLAGVKQKLTT